MTEKKVRTYMKLIKMICTALAALMISMAVTFAPAAPVQADTFETAAFTVSEGEGEEPGVIDQDQQTRTAIFYLMPSVIMAIVLTFIVINQKKANRKR